jgi:hypothetical protein
MDGFDEKLKKMKEERKREKTELTGVGKKGKKAEKTGKMVPARKGSSVSSLSSGVVRAGSVSSEEVEGALKEMEAQGGEKEKGKA